MCIFILSNDTKTKLLLKISSWIRLCVIGIWLNTVQGHQTVFRCQWDKLNRASKTPRYRNIMQHNFHITVTFDSAVCKCVTNTEVLDCHGQTFPHRNNSAPFLHPLQQQNPTQPLPTTVQFLCLCVMVELLYDKGQLPCC